MLLHSLTAYVGPQALLQRVVCEVRALVVLPTKELAQQVNGDCVGMLLLSVIALLSLLIIKFVSSSLVRCARCLTFTWMVPD